MNIPQSAINSIIKTRNIMAQPWLYLEVKVTWQEGKDETDVAGEIHSLEGRSCSQDSDKAGLYEIVVSHMKSCSEGMLRMPSLEWSMVVVALCCGSGQG